VADADAVAFSVPMHTAMRLALASAERIRESNATTPIAFYGLYARVVVRILLTGWPTPS
jgi:hypothetical protein